MRIGIISDTHGRLHPAVRDAFAGVDHILHAGDVGGERILEQLGEIAPVTAVGGNIDGFRCGEAGEVARVTLDGFEFFVTHIIDRPSKVEPRVEAMLRENPADVVVFGHSHLPHNERVGAIWYFNPASAGPRRFDYPVSVGIFAKLGSEWNAWHVPLDEESREALPRYMNRLR